MWKAQKIGKIEKLKSCDSLAENDGLLNFEQTNVVNVEPVATHFGESIVKRVELDSQSLLRDPFYPP